MTRAEVDNLHPDRISHTNSDDNIDNIYTYDAFVYECCTLSREKY